MNLPLLFNFANLFVLPFWTLMILLPNWGITKKVMASYLPFVALAGLYVYLFLGTFDAESVAVFANPQLPDLARLFSQEKITFTGWVHFLVLDLFVGRYIYWEGQRTGIWTVHSLIFCLFAGPIGLLSHILTVGIGEKFLNKAESDATQAT
jgi:hypothetical protein